jgi:hypothetical protein
MKLWDYIQQILNRQNLYLNNVFFCKKKKEVVEERKTHEKKKMHTHTQQQYSMYLQLQAIKIWLDHILFLWPSIHMIVAH